MGESSVSIMAHGGQVHVLTDRHTHTQTDRQTDRQTDTIHSLYDDVLLMSHSYTMSRL